MKIRITKAAKEVLAPKVEENSKPIRLYLQDMGCCGGPTFSIAFDKRKDDDIDFDIDGFNIIVNRDLVDTFDSFTIDYHVWKWSRGFHVKPY